MKQFLFWQTLSLVHWLIALFELLSGGDFRTSTLTAMLCQVLANQEYYS